jgi:hypothetical protein
MDDATEIGIFIHDLYKETEDETEIKCLELSRQLYDREKCPQCKEKYNMNDSLPRILPQCGHCFCTKCVTSLITDSFIVCPECESILTDVGSFQDVPVNQQIFHQFSTKLNQNMSMSESSRFYYREQNIKIPLEQRNCKKHQDKPIEFYCESENLFMCQICLKSHKHKDI